jgi:hypothetical protein
MPSTRALATAHAGYYGVTGVWPLVHMSSFEALLGKKREHWLVQTVSLLMLAIAAGLGTSVNAVPRPMALTASLAAAGMGAIGLRYGLSGRISRLYVADALLQYAIAGLWLSSIAQSQQDRRDIGENE